MAIYTKKLKYVSLSIDGNEFRAQCYHWKIIDNTEDGDKQYTYGPDGQNEDREDVDPDFSLELKFFSDWRTPTGISHWLWTNRGLIVDVEIGHNLGDTGADPSWTGTVEVKAPPVAGEVRTTEITEITLPFVGEPVYVPAA
jgi:hypothetical protein